MEFDLELVHLGKAVEPDRQVDDLVVATGLHGKAPFNSIEDFFVLLSVLMGGGVNKICLDLKELAYIDSTGVGKIVQMTKKLREAGGDLVLVNASVRLLSVFSALNISSFLRILPDRAAAERHFRQA